MPVPTRNVVVRTATAVRKVSGSLWLPGRKWWCPMVAVSKPDSSAMRASSKVWANGSLAPGSRKAGIVTENFMPSAERGRLDKKRFEHEVELEDVAEGQDAEPTQVGAH